MKTLTYRSTIALAVAAAIAGFSSAAGASEVKFRFHASELSDPQRLYERMAERAEAACRISGRPVLGHRKAEAACAADLLDDFVEAAASPSLTAVHEHSTGERFAGFR